MPYSLTNKTITVTTGINGDDSSNTNIKNQVKHENENLRAIKNKNLNKKELLESSKTLFSQFDMNVNKYMEKINNEVLKKELFDDILEHIENVMSKVAQEKILIYGALMYTDEEDFDSSKNIITINILHTQFFKTEDYHKIITFNEKGLIFHVIELPKFNKTKIKTEKDAWIAYLSTNDVEIHKISKEKNEKIDKLDKEIDNYWKDEIL